MSKNLFKKGLALGTVLALGVTGLTGVAASAATGDVTIAPTSGTKYGAFTNDAFSLKTNVSTSVISSATLAYAITNPDKTNLYINLESATLTDGRAITLQGFDALGNQVDLDALDTSSVNDNVAVIVIEEEGASAGFNDAEDEVRGEYEFDSAFWGVTKLVIRTIDANAAVNTLKIQPIEDTTTGTTDDSGLRTVSSATTSLRAGASNPFEFGDGNASVTVQSWVETQATPDYSTVDAAYASDAQKISWIDAASVAPIVRVENFIKADGTSLLNTATAVIAGSIEFPSTINLDQIGVSNLDLEDGSTNLTETYAAPAGFSSADAAGRLYFTATETHTLDTAVALDLKFANDSANTEFKAVSYKSTAGSSDATIDGIQATVTDTVNGLQDDATDTSISVRPGTKSVTFQAQLLDQASAAATGHTKAVSSVKVLAVVRATSYLTADGSYTVSGANGSVAKLNRGVIATGLTDAKGQFSVTVTSTTALKNEAFTVKFYVINELGVAVVSAGGTAYTATYTDASVSTLTSDNDVLSGSSVTVKFTVKDSYAQVASKSGTDALFIRVRASNTTNLDKDIAVGADGTASITFTNYVTAGSSDNITANVYKGTASTPGTSLAVKVLTLYNPGAVATVNAPATLSTDITYDDFVTGAESATNVGPNDGGVAVSGTVTDANAAGVPGAVVTVAAKGLLFKKTGGTTWYADTITIAADAGGAYSVTAFSHTVNTTGASVTITSGGKSATSTLKTYLPSSGVDGNNLEFSWKLPALLAKNTTYAVTAKLVDKWGNPVATAKRTANSIDYNGITFQGFGSVEVNSSSSAVSKNFDKNGSVTVFVRSVKDIAGPGSIEASLGAANYTATSSASATALAVTEIATNVTTTKWDETAFKNVLSANIEIFEAKPTATVSASSKKANVVVKNASGATVTVVSGTKSVTKVATSNSFKVSLTKLTAGKKTVKVYVNDVLVSSKSVTVKK